jgi:molecular chaperone GrpE (heat shock protein)
MARRRGSSRAAALRRAQGAKAERDAERMCREAQIEATLADYYQATAEAERIRSNAQHKAEATLAEAEQAAAKPVAAARDAVQRLRNLVGGNAEVAALCGISTATVREMLAAVHGTGPGDGANAATPAQ